MTSALGFKAKRHLTCRQQNAKFYILNSIFYLPCTVDSLKTHVNFAELPSSIVTDLGNVQNSGSFVDSVSSTTLRRKPRKTTERNQYCNLTINFITDNTTTVTKAEKYHQIIFLIIGNVVDIVQI